MLLLAAAAAASLVVFPDSCTVFYCKTTHIELGLTCKALSSLMNLFWFTPFSVFTIFHIIHI